MILGKNLPPSGGKAQHFDDRFWVELFGSQTDHVAEAPAVAVMFDV
jgi:hypothetical protein